MIETFGRVAATASSTVLKTGTPCSVSPPLPGVTPATTFVPYSIICFAWKLPSRPVIPWTSRRVSLLTRIAKVFLLLRRRNHLLRGLFHRVGGDQVAAGVAQDAAAFLLVGAEEADDERDLDL